MKDRTPVGRGMRGSSSPGSPVENTPPNKSTAQDLELLELLQKEFPLVSRPFAVLAERVGLTEEEVCVKVRDWQATGLIRRLGAVFDSRRLGYHSTLAAMRVPLERIEEVAAVINACPGVTHNYLRESDLQESCASATALYNLWFTITAHSKTALDAAVNQIKQESGIDDLICLPATQLYKINVQFDLNVDLNGGWDA